MKDMFYEYDHHPNKKDYPWLRPKKCPDILDNSKNLTIVQDVKGQKLGVRAKANSEFVLYFDLDGYIEDYDFHTFLADKSAVLEIYNDRHELILTTDTSENLKIVDGSIEATLYASEEGPLKTGIYGMRLLLNYAIGATPYILYSEKDGFLSIM